MNSSTYIGAQHWQENCQLGVLKFVNNSIRVICSNTNDILSVDLWSTRANVIFTITIEGESIYLYDAISDDDSVGVKLTVALSTSISTCVR